MIKKYINNSAIPRDIDDVNRDQQRLLDDFIKQNNIQLKKFYFQNPVSDSNLSSKEVGIDLSRIIKTVVFKDERGNIYAAIVRAQQDVDRKIIKKLYKINDLRLIPREEVVKEIGYPAGGVPPFGFLANFMMDVSLGGEEVVYAGGGSIYSLIEIKISEIERVSQLNKIKISKK